MAKPIISADSHITEPPDTYTARIDRRFKDRAPRVVRDPKRGDLFVIEGIDRPVPMGLVAAAGKPAEELTKFGARFEDMHRGGWDPEARLADQERDGAAAEVLYPTVGMMLCNHPDVDFKQACFDAYNLYTLGRRRHPRPRADQGPRAPRPGASTSAGCFARGSPPT